MFNIAKGNSGLRLHNCPGPAAAALPASLPCEHQRCRAANRQLGAENFSCQGAHSVTEGLKCPLKEADSLHTDPQPDAAVSRERNQPLHNWSWWAGEKPPRNTEPSNLCQLSSFPNRSNISSNQLLAISSNSWVSRKSPPQAYFQFKYLCSFFPSHSVPP